MTLPYPNVQPLAFAATGRRSWLWRWRLRWLLRCWLSFVGLAGFASAAWALDPALALSQLNHTAWGTEQGAPGSIWAMAQTRDGLLWLATPSGLYSFDGVRFERFEGVGGERLRSANVETVFATRAGGLWVGLRYGGAAWLQDGHLRQFGTEVGLPDGSSVTAFAEGPAGELWVGTVAGLLRFDGQHWQDFGPEQGLSRTWVKTLRVDSQGTLWASKVDGLYALPRDASRFEAFMPERARGYLATGQDGSVWLSGTEAPLQRLVPPSSGVGLPARPGKAAKLLLPEGSGQLLVDRHGTLWVSMEGEVRRIRKPEQLQPGLSALPADRYEALTTRQGMTGPKVWSMLEDREGNLWFGTSEGLDRLRAPKLTALPLPPRTLGFSLAPGDDNAVLAASPESGEPVLALQGDQARPLPGWPGVVTASFRDGAGVLWLGTQQALWRVVRGRLEPAALPAELVRPSERGNRNLLIQAFAEAPDHSLWMSVSRRGIYRLAEGNWQKWSGEHGLPSRAALAMHTDRQGVLWLAYGGGQVVAVPRDGPPRVYGEAQGLALGTVLVMADSASGLWLGGEQGLAHFDGQRFQAMASADGRGLRGISGLVQTAGGELWAHGSEGLVRLDAAQVRAWLAAPGRPVVCEHFDHRDGLIGAAVQSYPLPTLLQAGDGRLWVATQSGLASIVPGQIRRNAVAPDVLIRALWVDGQRLETQAPLALPAGANALQIDYTATSLGQPERVRFRYQLEGSDAGWTEAGSRRQAFYTHLPPGDYRFRVVAANEDGVWSPQGASLAIRIAPAWFETWWWRAGCAVALLGLGALFYRWRLHRLAARVKERTRERIRERERIARELHDTLLQGMQGLILNIQGGLLRLPATDEMRHMLELSLDQAESVLVEGRQRVTQLRLAEQEGEPIDVYLARWGRELALQHPAEFALSSQGEPRPLKFEAQCELAMIGREALFNAFRHAQARRIEVQLAYSEAAFTLRVVDDGQGMPADAAPARSDHWGMAGMRERAEQLGSLLQLLANPGGGTAIEVRLSAAQAFS